MGQSETASRRASVWHGVILVAITLLVFQPLVTGDFVNWDDPHNLTANPAMNPPSLSSVGQYWRDWRNGVRGLYVPVTYTIWSAIAAVAGTTAPGSRQVVLNPVLFHSFNLLLHALSVLCVYSILRRLLGGAWGPWLGALLFAIHPVQVESVGWVSGMKDVLAGLLQLVALRLYMAYVDAAAGKEDPRRIAGLYAGAIAVFAVAILSKPSAVMLPVIVGAIDWGLLRRPVLRVARDLGAWVILAIPFVLIGRAVQTISPQAFIAPLWFRPIVALDALAFYVRQLVAPFWLTIDYGRSPDWLMRSPQRFYTWLIPAVVAALVLWRGRRREVVAPAVVFVACLLPVLGFTPFSFQSYSSVSDHYLYLAMLGPALLLGWLLRGVDGAEESGGGARGRGRPRAKGIVIAAAVLLALFAIQSHIQTYHWRSSRALFTHAIAVNPDSLAGNMNLANVLTAEADELRRLRRPAEADAKLERAVSLLQHVARTQPNHPDIGSNMGNALLRLNRIAEAIEAYRKSLEITKSADVLAQLAAAYGKAGEHEQAIIAYQEALRLDARRADTWFNLGNALGRQNRVSEAFEAYRRSAALENAPDVNLQLGRVCMLQGQTDQAIQYFSEAVRLAPELPIARQTLEAALAYKRNGPATRPGR